MLADPSGSWTLVEGRGPVVPPPDAEISTDGCFCSVYVDHRPVATWYRMPKDDQRANANALISQILNADPELLTALAEALHTTTT